MTGIKVVLVACLLVLIPPVLSSISHQYTFSSHLPPHLGIMFSMSWFGITGADPQGAGQDPTFGNWQWGVKTNSCVIPTTEPTQCNTGTPFTLTFPSPQRWIASKRRPLAGYYSASARDAESKARIDLMLSNVRRPCDGGANARLDAWSVQQNSIHFSSLYQAQGTKYYCATCDMAYRALISFCEQAESAGMQNVIIPGIDGSWIFNFGGDYGQPNKTACIEVLTDDVTDMAKISMQYSNTAVHVNGLPVLLIYLDGSLSVSQWGTILQTARNNVNSDFYAVAMGPGISTDFFQVFDAVAPWTSADYSLNNPPYNTAYSWAQAKHANYVSVAKTLTGRVAFGSMVAGFDDYTENWGTCKPRVMERATVLIEAASDYLLSVNVTHTIAQTWDDWTEGTHFEPDVNSGTEMLVALKQGLGKLAREAADPIGDAALNARWTSYGQARNCNGGKAGTPPTINLACPTPAPTPKVAIISL